LGARKKKPVAIPPPAHSRRLEMFDRINLLPRIVVTVTVKVKVVVKKR
jgi:hypothetical protein